MSASRTTFVVALVACLPFVFATVDAAAAGPYRAKLYGDSGSIWTGYPGNVGMDRVASADGGAVHVGSRLSYPERDLEFLKTNADGSIQWQKKLNGARVFSFQQDYLPAYLNRTASVIKTSDGNYAVTFASEIVTDVAKVAVVKFDEAGNVLWYKHYDGNYSDREFPTHLEELNDGSLVVFGNLENQINRAFFIKLNSDGSLNKHTVLQDPVSYNYFKGRFMTKLADNTLMAITEASSGDALVHLDSELNVLSVRQYSSDTQRVSLQALAQRSDGVIGVAATLGTSADANLGFIALDDAGNPLSVVSASSSTGDHASSITPTLDGGFYIGGYTGAYAPNELPQSTFNAVEDAFAMRVDANYNYQWSKVYNTKQWYWNVARDIVTGVDADASGDLIMSGATYLPKRWAILQMRTDANGDMSGSSVKVTNGTAKESTQINVHDGSTTVVPNTSISVEIKTPAVSTTSLVLYTY